MLQGNQLHHNRRNIDGPCIGPQHWGDARRVKPERFFPFRLNQVSQVLSARFEQVEKYSQKLGHLYRKISLEVRVVMVEMDSKCYYHSLIALRYILVNSAHLLVCIDASLEIYKDSKVWSLRGAMMSYLFV
jgi:hypothetical protein